MLTKSHDQEIIQLVPTFKQLDIGNACTVKIFSTLSNYALKKTNFSSQKMVDELGLKAKSAAQSIYNRYQKTSFIKNFVIKKLQKIV